jgi:hypothetical protein
MRGIADIVTTTVNKIPLEEERSVVAAVVSDGRTGSAKTTEIQAAEEIHGEMTEVTAMWVGGGMI